MPSYFLNRSVSVNNPGWGVPFPPLFFLFLISFYLPAQTSDKPFKWAEKGNYETTQDTFPDEHLLILQKDVVFSVESIKNTYRVDFSSTLFTHLKMKVLIQEDPAAGTAFQIPFYDFRDLHTLAARIIKPGGKVIDIPAKNIRHVAADSITDKNPEGNIITYIIPHTETGDEVEVVVLLSADFLHSYGEVFLNDPDHICLHSSYTSFLPVDYTVDLKYYNNMPSAKTDTVKNHVHSTWVMQNLSPLHKEEFSIPQSEFPFLRYAIRSVSSSYNYNNGSWYYNYQGEPSSWFDYASSLSEIVSMAPPFLRNRLTKHFNTQYDIYLTYSTNPDTLSRIIRFFNYVHDHVHVVDVPYEKFDSSIDYYLKRNEILEPFMIFFFDRMFRELNLNYFVGLGKDKYTGPYDQAFVTGKMATHLFIGFEYHTHFYYIFFSTKTKSYEFGEVPPCLRGTDAMLISKNNIEYPVQKFTFPVLDKNQNLCRTNVFLTIDPLKNTILRKDRLTLSGEMSTDYRFGYYMNGDPENKLIVKTARELKAAGSGYVLDSVKVEKQEKSSPFLFTIESHAHSGMPVQHPQPQSLFIPLKGVICHHLLVSSSQKRKTRLFTPYPYTDNVKVYLVFSQKIELVNADKLNAGWKGIPGHYTLHAIQVNETTILIDSEYVIEAERLQPAEVNDLKEMNAKANEAGDLQIEVKLVP